MSNPSPGHSIITLLRKDLLDTLASISSLSGYRIDVPNAADSERQGTRFELYKCTVSHDGAQWTQEGFAQGHDEGMWNFDIHLDIDKPQTAVDGMLIGDTDELCETAADDVRHAVYVDRTRSAYAFNTVLTGWVKREDNLGIIVSGFCTYRTLLGRPNEQ